MSKNWRILLTIIGLLLLVLAAWYFRTLLIYLFTAAILSIVGSPVVRWLKKVPFGKWHMPSWMAAVITLVLFLTIGIAFLSLFAPLIAAEAAALGKVDFGKTWTQLEGHLERSEAWLSQFNLSGDEQPNRDFLMSRFKEFINLNELSGLFNNIFGVLGNIFVATFSILFMTFFFLKDGYLLNRIIFTITPNDYVDEVKNIMTSARHHLTRYFVGVLVQVTIVTLLITLGLTVLGIKNAFIIGFLAGMMNLIPYVGPIIGMIVGVIIALTTNLDLDVQTALLPLLGKVVGVFLLVQLIDNFFTQPVILGNSVQAHPLEIFIVISLAATLAGVAGMIVAIPAYTMLRIVAKEFLSRSKIVQSLTKGL
ncbi:MAG: AI-2E family transporter [Flavobacteriales bacterium]|nr:AI-2E family transporter [Flavobacteriales bacterium]